LHFADEHIHVLFIPVVSNIRLFLFTFFNNRSALALLERFFLLVVFSIVMLLAIYLLVSYDCHLLRLLLVLNNL
jgi:hypothetical protein